MSANNPLAKINQILKPSLEWQELPTQSDGKASYLVKPQNERDEAYPSLREVKNGAYF